MTRWVRENRRKKETEQREERERKKEREGKKKMRSKGKVAGEEEPGSFLRVCESDSSLEFLCIASLRKI